MKIVKIRNSSKLQDVLSEIDKAGMKEVEVHIYGTDNLNYDDALEIAINIKQIPEIKVKGMTDLNLKGLIILVAVKDRSFDIESVAIIDQSILSNLKDLKILEKALCKDSTSKLKDLDLRNLIAANYELDVKLLKKHGLCNKFDGEQTKRKKRLLKKNPSKTTSPDNSNKDKESNNQSKSKTEEEKTTVPASESQELKDLNTKEPDDQSNNKTEEGKTTVNASEAQEPKDIPTKIKLNTTTVAKKEKKN